MVKPSNVRALENAVRINSSQNRITLDSPDPRVPPVRGLEISAKTIDSTLVSLGVITNPVSAALMWKNPNSQQVDRYEVWARNSLDTKFRHIGEVKDAPFIFQSNSTQDEVVTLCVITVLKDGKRNNLKSCPCTTVEVAVSVP
jgi:hypothetical protein